MILFAQFSEIISKLNKVYEIEIDPYQKAVRKNNLEVRFVVAKYHGKNTETTTNHKQTRFILVLAFVYFGS